MTKKQSPSRPITARPGTPVDLDDIDWEILRHLSRDGDLTVKALATRLGLAESTCAYRIRGLRDSGVITGTRLGVNYALLGYPLQAIIKVRLGNHSEATVNTLYQDLAAAPGVIQAFHVAGADDFYLHVAVPSAEELRDFVLRHVTSHTVVRQTETQLVFGVKDGAGPTGAGTPVHRGPSS